MRRHGDGRVIGSDFVPLMMGELPYARVDVELAQALARAARELDVKKPRGEARLG